MTGPEGVDMPGPEPEAPEAPEAAAGPAPVPPSHRLRREAPVPVRGHWKALVSVVVVVGVVFVISWAFPAPGAQPAPVAADGVAVPPAGAYSSSAFCAAGTGTDATSTVYLTNSTSRPVTGQMTTVDPAGSGGSVTTVRRSVVVPALSTDAFNPTTGLPPGSTASSFGFAGGGVVATQIVSGPDGWSTAPCASQTSPQWAFAGGSTAGGNTLELALFDPAAPEAVVNVSFVTSTGLIAPQTYQGLVIPAGHMVVENVGDFVQGASDIGTVVTAQSGTLVSSEFQQWSQGSGDGLSLRLGSPSLSTVWRFAQTTTRAGDTVDFDLVNPGSVTATATLTVGLAAGSVVPRRVVIPPVSIVAFAASGTNGLPQQIPYAVTVTSSAPIAVGRRVLAAAGSTPPLWGASSATVTTATRWLVPSPGIPQAPGTAGATVNSLAVADPGPTAARVVVTILGGRRVATFVVAADAVAVVGSKRVGGLSDLGVVSSQPVNVEADAGPSGAPGVVASTGFPFVDQG